MICKERSLINRRNYGIDLLRIIAMIMIPVLHVLGQGGILGDCALLSAHYIVAWFLEIMAYCAVNCYALISGYVGYGSKTKYSNLINLCFQVSFYTLIITAIFKVCMPGSIGLKDIIKAIFPIPFGVYWYVTAYFCMFFFIPVMNLVIDKAPRKMVRNLIWSIIIIASVISTVFRTDMFELEGGYSALWLGMLYIIGAYIKKYDLNSKVSVRGCLAAYLVFVIITWGSKLILDILSNVLSIVFPGNILVSYTSPTILGAGIALLLCFSKIKVGSIWKKIISFFAPVAFGIYLIHVEPMIWDNIIQNRFAGYLNLNPVLMALAVIATAMGIWFICSLIDRLRLELFKVLKIKQLSIKIENWLDMLN